MRLGDVVPRLKVEPGKWYTVEATANADTDRSEGDFGPIYAITVLHDGKPVSLMGGQNLVDNLVPLLKADGSMTQLRVMKEWVRDEEGEESIEWSVEVKG